MDGFAERKNLTDEIIQARSSNVIFLFLFLEGIPFIILYKNPKVN